MEVASFVTPPTTSIARFRLSMANRIITIRDFRQHEMLLASVITSRDDDAMHDPIQGLTFGARLQYWRNKARLTQGELAKKVGWKDAQNRISNYERSKREPSHSELIALCKALDVTPNDLLWPKYAQDATGIYPRTTNDRLHGLTEDEASMLLRGYSTLSDADKTKVWDILDAHLRELEPGISQFLGPRDVAKSRSIEPKLITGQIISRVQPPPSELEPLSGRTETKKSKMTNSKHSRISKKPRNKRAGE